MIKVVIIGYGHLGRWHLDKALSFANVEVIGVVDPSEITSVLLKDRNIDVDVYSSLDEVIDKIDAAFVVTPTSLHFDIIIKLLENNKHVFCEKPMTSTFEQAVKVKELLTSKSVVFQVGHSERFHNVWSQVRDLKQYFTKTSHISIERQAMFKGRATDVDVVQDLMIHDLDLVLFLLEEKPSKVSAIGYKIRTENWDYVKATLSFPSGKSAQIVSGRNYTKEVRTFEVMGPIGCISVDLFRNNISLAPSDSTNDHVVESQYEKRDHLLEEHKHFYNSIENGQPAIVDINAGCAAVLLVSKVLESLEKSSEVVL